jgi:polysaccharide export outer membrane protein
MELAVKFNQDASVHVLVKQINSRKVFITGDVPKPGPYPLSSQMTVVQLISLAGGVGEFAKADQIGVLRTENGKPRFLRVNFKDLQKGKNLNQNVQLQIGDVVMVPR